MTNVIKIKRSSTAGAAPASLADGEFAINTADKKLFFKNSAGTVVSFSMAVVDTSAALAGKSDTTHVHGAATSAADGFMAAADKAKLDGIAAGATAYVHPSGDGSLHVPATGPTNNGKVLKAGSTAGSIAWGSVAWSDLASLPAAISTFAGLTPAADQIPYYTGAGAAALASFTSFGRSLVAGADAAALRTTLGLGSAALQASSAFAAAVHGHGISDVTGLQAALDAKLAASGYTANDVLAKLIGVDGTGSGLDADHVRGATPTTFGLARLTDADAAAARSGLGLGAMALLGSAVVDYQVFTASGTWPKPAGLSANAMVVVFMWGGGGSGGFRTTYGAAGGGGGGFTWAFFPAAALAATVAVTVGAGGAAVTTTSTNGNAGGASSFAGISAAGGGGGAYPTGSTGSTGGAGGAAMSLGVDSGAGSITTGSSATFGGAGGGGRDSSGVTYPGGASVYGGGGGAGANNAAIAGGTSTHGGGGGNALATGVGNDGVAPGGGGAGGRTTTSGAGARGEVRVWVIG